MFKREDVPSADSDVKLPDSAPDDLDARAAYTAETGSYMYMCPEVTCTSHELHQHHKMRLLRS